MEPTSLSASALKTFELCPARYKAENIDRARGMGGDAARLGTSVHGGLEEYVKTVYISKSAPPNLNLLLMFYKASYIDTFGTSETDTVEYMEGYKMTVDWFERNLQWDYFNKIERVVSVEIKDNFEVPTSLGPLTWNYIWDRFDQVGPRKFKVVDYKTNRWNIQASDLSKKIQPRAYGLACAIQLARQGIEYDEIWVEFDMLRHGGPRGIEFTREMNAATWRYIKASAQKIVDTPDDEAEERLNNECTFCVRKASCKALAKNLTVGGIHSVGSVEDAIDLRANIGFQKAGIESLIRELDKKILAEAKQRDIDQFESDMNELAVTVSRTRVVDPAMVEMAIGPKLFSKYGSHKIAMGSIDKLLKGNELTPQQKSQLRGLIDFDVSEPKVKITPKNGM